MIRIGKDTSDRSSEHDNEVQGTARLRDGFSKVGIFYIHSFIHSLLQSTLRQVHSLSQSEFSAQCYLVLPLSISSTI